MFAKLLDVVARIESKLRPEKEVDTFLFGLPLPNSQWKREACVRI